MSYQSKKLWDEILDNLDPKYANEAAELFGKQTGTDGDEYGELVPVQARKLPQVQSKKRVIGSIIGFVAAAAVLAVSVVTAVKYMKTDEFVQSDPKDSSVSDGSSTAEAINYMNILDEIELPVDPSLYSEDFSIYEKYFCGKWKNAYSSSAAERDNIYYVGYAPSDNVLFGRYYGFGEELIGFYEDERGAYMASFAFMNDGSGEVLRALIVFAPADDTDTLYLFEDYPSDSENRAEAPSVIYLRDGEYSEENNSALNYFGVHKLCAEMGIEPELLYGNVTYDEEDIYQTRHEGTLSPAGYDIIVNNRTDDRLEYAVDSAYVLPSGRSERSELYNIALTKENGEWGEPVISDRVVLLYNYDLDQVFDIPENTGEIDYDVLEEYFFGEWNWHPFEGKGSSVISVTYSDRKANDEELGVLAAVFRNDDGAFAFMDDGAVYFVPENSRQFMYYVWDREPGHYMLYRMQDCATADSRDFYGELTELGRSRLFEKLGGGFEDAYNNFMEYSPLFIMNGDNWRLSGEPFVCAAEIGENRAALVHKYYKDDGSDSTAYCVNVFEKKDGEWEYTDTYYDIDYDYAVFEGYDTIDDTAEGLKLYEDIFFGEWERADGRGDTAVCSYSEEIWGTGLPAVGSDGYYMSRLNGGAFEMFFIPFADTDSMYFYGEGTFWFDDDGGRFVSQKRNYDRKYVRNSTQLDKELHDMMTLSWRFGRYKLIDYAGGNFSDLFHEIEFSEEFILDKNGVSWKSGMYQGYLASADFDPVLVSLAEDRIIISQTYYQPIDNGYGGVGYDSVSTFENGMLKNFLLTFTKQDGVWVCDISDTGESIDTLIGFEMDMSIFPHFMGVWSNNDTSYTLDYYHDFCEPYMSWITGFEETDSMWLMQVHRVAAGYNSPVIPDETGDTLFVIEKDDPDTVKLYRYENKLPEGEPQRIFTRSGTVDPSLPDRGYISIYGLYALMDAVDTDGSLERVMREYCFDGSIAAAGGVTLYAYPNETSKPEYVILERSGDKVKLATTFYSENKTAAYDYIVTFGRSYGSNSGEEWHMSAYEPAIYGLDGAEKLPVDNGWYAFSEESDGTHLYFYDSSDNIIYELDESIGERYIYTLNGNDLFLLDCYGNGIYRYISGRAAGSTYIYDCDSIDDEENVKRSLMPEFLQFSGEYLLAGAYLGGEPVYRVYAPYRTIDMRPIITTGFLEISENGFTFEQDGERVFRDTEDDSIESVLPLLELQHNEVWSIMNIDSGRLVGDNVYTNYDSTVVIDGLHYYRCYNGLFQTYEDFKEYLDRCFTFDCVAELMIDNTSVREYNGYLYTTGGARGSNIEVAKVFRHENIYFTDDIHRELQYEVYGYSDDDRTTPAEKPYETYRMFLVKTSEGWRFSNCYSPF